MNGDRSSEDHSPVDDEYEPRDSVDALLRSWRARRPELDLEPVAVIARLNRLRSHIDPALAEVFAAHALSSPNFGVLVTLARIGEDGRVSQRRLMDELGLTSGTISVRIDRLVEEGLVDRQTDPESKRNTLITLTERGREIVHRAVPAHLANERRLLAALSDDEQRTLASLLRKLLVEFEGSQPPAGARFRLGVTLAPAHVAIAMRQSVGLPPVPALLVRSVEDGEPAAAAGVRTGDLLLRAGTRQLRSIGALYEAIAGAGENRRLRIVLLRGMEEHRVTVRLGDARTAHDTVAATAGRTARGEHVV
jgi:DNA-binding MarR family transcriptional regulator